MARRGKDRRDAQRAMAAVRTDAQSVGSIRLLRQRRRWAVAHALPSAVVQVLASCVTFVFPLPMFWAAFLLAVLLAGQALLFLVQHWSVSARARLAFTAPQDIQAATHVHVVPVRHRGKAAIEPVVRMQRSSLTHVMPDLGRDAVAKVSDQKCIEPRVCHAFWFQKRLFVYDEQQDAFRKVHFPKKDLLQAYRLAAQGSGPLSLAEASEQLLADVQAVHGKNELHIPTPTFWEMYSEHLLAPFFVFQVFCVLLWMLDEYWYYSLMTLAMMMIFEATTVKGRLRSLQELRGMRNAPQTLMALRRNAVLSSSSAQSSSANSYRSASNKWMSLSSADLLPGDVVCMTRSRSPEDVIPCDMLLLSGTAVVNEAMLTGESIPLVKEAIALLEDEQADSGSQGKRLAIHDEHKSNVLFGGTIVLTVTPGTAGAPSEGGPTVVKMPVHDGCLAMVIRTGFGSSQGKLMRTIMYSQEAVSANSKEAAGFIVFLLCFASAASAYVLRQGLLDQSRSRYELLLHCILIVTSVIPPELPMQLALAVNTSLVALSRMAIFCTEPFRIPLAGMLDVCCFDKTGTVTTDQIRAVGVCVSLVSPSAPCEPVLIPVHEAPWDASLVLAGCNSLAWLERELVGDPLELEALQSVQWTLSRNDVVIPPKYKSTGNDEPVQGSAVVAKIVQRFKFLSALQRMSTIVSLDEQCSRFRALLKGSPEMVGTLLKEVPVGYFETAGQLARQGFRVLALAHREIESSEANSLSSVRAMKREALEQGLLFDGFIVFECPLRADSASAIKALRKANHQVMLITGDALLTAAHVARAVSLSVKPMVFLEQGFCTEDQKHDFSWVSIQTGKRRGKLDVFKLDAFAQDYSLCMTGDILRLLESELAPDAWTFLLTRMHLFRVFARMRPNQKELVLTSLKDSGLCTLMCGDGTNDVGALKQAHVGVALLSHAVMPNASKNAAEGTKASAVSSASMTGGSGPSSKRQQPSASGLRSRKEAKRDESSENISTGSSVSTLGTQRKPAFVSKLEEVSEKLEDMQDEGEDRPPLVKLGDASIASPFTSKRMTIDSCVNIIRQGRCTLATTLQMYQILALNCLISSYGLSVLYLEGVKLGDRQMTVVGVASAMVFFMISRSQPLTKLSFERPASSIFSPPLFVSLLGQFVIHLSFLVYLTELAKAHLGDDFEPDIEGLYTPNVLNTVVFLISTFQQVSVFVTNYKGRPFMQGIRDNKYLRNVLAGIAVWNLTLASQLVPAWNEFFQLERLPQYIHTLPLVTDEGMSKLVAWGVPLSFPLLVIVASVVNVLLAHGFDRAVVALLKSNKRITLP
ncbi:putative manganese-transporting ATPase PDR2 [Porphyridium purpureum]|uniref:Putative manganese-transporting ATPase PDR2 n=1 Tax=Porphyridium purpureum TaxID=35688 RepID=A0A5J4Z9E5_PORPP|nr:putative manganese-transporting ATPase PDR2 [Porphyridium purpureum]|eukprot:POR8858..scf295_1